MMRYSKTLLTILAVFYLASLAGCAAPPKRGEISRKDMLIQNLTEENAALRKEIDRLTETNEELRRSNIKLKSERESKPEKGSSKDIK